MQKKGILELLDNTFYSDDAGFRNIIFRVLEDKCLTEKDLAHALNVSLPTVRRWASGQNAPHSAMRKHVFAYLKNALRSVSFDIDAKTWARIHRFKNEHECSLPDASAKDQKETGERKRTGSIGGRWTYSFTPTSLGTAITVHCACGKEENVTDYDSWRK